MSLPRIVVDNSAMIPAFFSEPEQASFDAGLVTNRAKALVHAIRMRRVNAYVPPSFFREFLNVATWPLYQPAGRTPENLAQIRAQWEELLSLPLIVVPMHEIIHYSGILAFDDACPAADAWYVATAVHASATLWMSHEHHDGLFTVASRYAKVRLLSKETSDY